MSPDVHIAAGTPTLDCIAAVFGHSIRRELLPLEVSREPPPQPRAGDRGHASSAAPSDAAGASGAAAVEDLDCGSSSSSSSSLRFRASGFVSSANYSMKRGVSVFFINDRLVDCAPLRKAMEVRV